MKFPQRETRLSYRTIGDETIILDSKINKQVHQLNEVGSFVWNLCDGKNNVEQICESICHEYDVQPAEAKSDIENLLRQFIEKGLLEK
jgi:hypothetical protein